MWLTFRLAWRHLMRSRRRSLLTVLAVLFPVLMLDLMWGLSGAMRRNLFENITTLETGHVQIHEAGYRKQGNTPSLIRDVRPVLEAVSRESAVRSFGVRLELPALAAHGDRSQGVIVRGVKPGQQGLDTVARWVREGRALRALDHKVVVAGAALLKKLDLALGDPLILITSHPQAGTGVLLPTVVGKILPPSRELSRFVVQVPLNDARTLVKNSQAATSVVLLLSGVSGVEDQKRIDTVAQRLQAALGKGYDVETWDKLSPETAAMFNIMGPLYAAFGMVFFVLAGLVVLNTLYLSVVERTRELGVVLALGSSRRLVLGWIETEAALLAALGCALGSALGVLIVRWGGRGFHLPGLYDELLNTLGMNATLYTRMSLGEALFSPVAMFLVALVAAYYPGWRAARLEPVEAMRFWG